MMRRHIAAVDHTSTDVHRLVSASQALVCVTAGWTASTQTTNATVVRSTIYLCLRTFAHH